MQNGTDKIIGLVKWFNETKGWGFIQSGGKDYFAHFKEIIPGDASTTRGNSTFRRLRDGQRVLFVPQKGQKGMLATQIQDYYVKDELEGDTMALDGRLAR